MLLVSAGLVLALVAAVVTLGDSARQPATAAPDDNPPNLEKLSITPVGPTPEPAAAATITAHHNELIDKSHRDYKEWLEAFNASGIDPKTLSWIESSAESLPPPRTLDEAVDKADLILSGAVTDVKYISRTTQSSPWPWKTWQRETRVGM
jgi:hypothetical protein